MKTSQASGIGKLVAGMFTVALAVGLGASTGCSTMETREKWLFVHKFGPDSPHETVLAPVSGDYILYRDGEKHYMARTYLNAGEPVGFKVDVKDSSGKLLGEPGTISAVAGQFALPIKSTSVYEWRRIPGTTLADKQDNPYWPRR